MTAPLVGLIVLSAVAIVGAALSAISTDSNEPSGGGDWPQAGPF